MSSRSASQPAACPPRFTSAPGSAHVHDDQLSFVTHGQPFPLPRPKTGSGRPPANVHSPPTKHRRHHVHQPSSNKEKKMFTSVMEQAFTGKRVSPVFLSSHVSVAATFWFGRPADHFDATGAVKPRHSSQIIQCKKADVDNLTKFLLDCIQHKTIGDDTMVQTIQCEKRWSDCCTESGARFQGLGAASVKTRLVDDPAPPPLVTFFPNSISPDVDHPKGSQNNAIDLT